MPRIRPSTALLALLLAGCSSRPDAPPDTSQPPQPQQPDARPDSQTQDPRPLPSPRSAQAQLSPAQEQDAAPEASREANSDAPGSGGLSSGLSSAIIAPAMVQSELPLRLPAPAVAPIVRDPRVPGLKAQIAKYRLFAAYRALEGIDLAAGSYAEAARLLREESGLYAAKGLQDASIIAAQSAARYEPSTALFQERAPTEQEVTALYSGAPGEPFIGCYLGAFIDRDDALRETYQDENFQTHRTSAEWSQAVGKGHGSLFMYLAYAGRNSNFPLRWVQELKAHGVIPHIAWEPGNLDDVRDDKYLQGFARACAGVDWPIFIRFASEMNGKWTPYHNDPRKYRKKFKLVNRVLHRYAPRVATIWCVSNPPLTNAFDYYPGDDGCDWVGVNFYSVPFHENRREQPAFEENPLAFLDPIYKRFAVHKPIAICEFAASHRPALDNITRNAFAIQKMSVVYSALPRLYPRVKLVDWFSMDTIARPTPGKTLSDYTLTQQPQVLAAYRQLISSPYFLSRAQRLSDPKPFLPRPLLDNTRLRGIERISAWCNLQLSGTKVFATLGGKVVYASAKPGAQEMALDLSRGPFGKQKLEVLVYDARNRFVTRTSRLVQVLS